MSYLYRIKGIGNKKKRIISPVKLDSPHLELMGESKDFGYVNGVIPQSEQGKPFKGIEKR